ncbi:MAG: lipopolysaccharide heptosyltransferase family protein, partial [Planctomycetota bacterium]
MEFWRKGVRISVGMGGFLKRNCFLFGVERRDILVIKPSSWGDILHTLPAVYHLHRRLSYLNIFWLCQSRYVEFLERISYVDGVISFERERYCWREFPRWLPHFWDWRRRWRGRFEVALDFQGLWRSALLGVLLEIPYRVGFQRPRERCEWLYHRRVWVPSGLHPVERNCALLEGLGLEVSFGEVEGEYVSIGEAELEEVRERLGLGDFYVLISPGSRWPSKVWPLERYVGLVGRILE